MAGKNQVFLTEAPNYGGVYNTKGVEFPTVTPSARYLGSLVCDSNDYIWYGFGYCCDGRTYNSLWRFNQKNRFWAWMTGDDMDPVSDYLQKGSPHNDVFPRYSPHVWIASNDTWILFGGKNPDSLSETCQFNTDTLSYTWISGILSPNSAGNYGTIGQGNSETFPAARGGGAFWTLNGAFWLFGGHNNQGTISVEFITFLLLFHQCFFDS